MKITNIEVIPIFPKLASRYAERRVDLYGIDCRVVYKSPHRRRYHRLRRHAVCGPTPNRPATP